MNRMLKKVSAVMLSLIMVLGTMGVYAYGDPIDEPQCICDTKCAEGEVNNDCPVCGGENGDISLCIGKEEEKEEAKCICDTKCAEDEINDNCPVCGGENGGISSCPGVGAMVLSTPSTRGIVATKPTEGDGSSTDPYQIGTAGELYWFAGLVNGTLTDGTEQNKAACAELTTDITVNTDVLDDDGDLNGDGNGLETWTPIGSYSNSISGDKAYTGTFDGQNHTISGLYVDSSNSGYVGLFGYVGKDGVIQNVGVKDSYISGDSYAGGVCGQNTGGIIENCYNTSEVSGNDYVGGVWGNNSSSGTITNCYNTGIVSGNIVGGVCGNISSYGTITNCYNTGSVSGERYAGGVCGSNWNGTIENCWNTGAVSGERYAGGVCGQNFSYGTIKNCYFLETATGGIGGGSGTANKVEEKENTAFASGEVAWLLNDGQESKPWVQELNKDVYPRLLASENDSYYVVLKITVDFFEEGKENSVYYININGRITYPKPEGGTYQFFADADYTEWIDTARKTYDADTTIYAASPVESIILNETNISLYVNGTETLTATVSPDTASKTLNWSSSDDTVATVDQNGTVKALKAGTATITAEAIDGSGVKAECTVTVRKKSSSSYVEYNLNFDTNGGDAMSTAVEQGNTPIDLDQYVPTREGYEFVGWYADEDLTKPIDEMTLTGGATIYAKWEKIEEELEEEEEIIEEEQEESLSFSDVRRGDWFYEAVYYAVSHDLMSGMGGGIFSPNTPLQKEMFAVILWNLEGNPAPEHIAKFLDVTSDKYYAEAIAWANENGIVAGFGDTFGVGLPITREQFAVMLHNYAQYKGYDVSVGEDTNILSYPDALEISEYAFPAMQWACGAGILGGNDDGTLNPQGQATRAEAATMLMNFCENVAK